MGTHCYMYLRVNVQWTTKLLENLILRSWWALKQAHATGVERCDRTVVVLMRCSMMSQQSVQHNSIERKLSYMSKMRQMACCTKAYKAVLWIPCMSGSYHCSATFLKVFTFEVPQPELRLCSRPNY